MDKVGEAEDRIFLEELRPLRRRRYVGDALVEEGISLNEKASAKMIQGLERMRAAHSKIASRVASQIMKVNVLKMFILMVILVLVMYIAFFKNETICKCEDILFCFTNQTAKKP